MEEEETVPLTKKIKNSTQSADGDQDLQMFLDWCESVGLLIDYDKVSDPSEFKVVVVKRL